MVGETIAFADLRATMPALQHELLGECLDTTVPEAVRQERLDLSVWGQHRVSMGQHWVSMGQPGVSIGFGAWIPRCRRQFARSDWACQYGVSIGSA